MHPKLSILTTADTCYIPWADQDLLRDLDELEVSAKATVVDRWMTPDLTQTGTVHMFEIIYCGHISTHFPGVVNPRKLNNNPPILHDASWYYSDTTINGWDWNIWNHPRMIYSCLPLDLPPGGARPLKLSLTRSAVRKLPTNDSLETDVVWTEALPWHGSTSMSVSWPMIYMMLIQTYLNPGLLFFQGSVEPIPDFGESVLIFRPKKKGRALLFWWRWSERLLFWRILGVELRDRGRIW